MYPLHHTFGSSATITPHANPLIARTFDLLKIFWIWPTLHQLDPYKHKFLSTFLSLVDLGSFIDSRTLVDHLSRTTLVQQYRPLPFMRNAKDGYVIAELVEFLHGEKYEGIHAGALFAQYVITGSIAQVRYSNPTDLYIDTFSATRFRLN